MIHKQLYDLIQENNGEITFSDICKTIVIDPKLGRKFYSAGLSAVLNQLIEFKLIVDIDGFYSIRKNWKDEMNFE